MGAEEVNGWEQEVKGWGWGVGGGVQEGIPGKRESIDGQEGKEGGDVSLPLFFSFFPYLI